MPRIVLSAFAAFIVLSASCTAVLAQDFTGKWSGRGSAVASGCEIDLLGDGRASSVSCLGSLSFLTSWKKRGAVIELFSISGERIAMVSGASNFMMGTTGDRKRFWMAKGSRCPVVAWGGDICVDQSDYFPPKGGSGNVTTIGGVNVRKTFDLASEKLTTVPANTCFKVYNCQQTDYGAIWCQADYANKSGWVTKLFVRDDQMWANFLNGCQ